MQTEKVGKGGKEEGREAERSRGEGDGGGAGGGAGGSGGGGGGGGAAMPSQEPEQERCVGKQAGKKEQELSLAAHREQLKTEHADTKKQGREAATAGQGGFIASWHGGGRRRGGKRRGAFLMRTCQMTATDMN